MRRRLAWSYRRVSDAGNRRLRTLLNGRFAHWCRPESISILLTYRCNARCVHCDIWKNKGREDLPTPQEWKRCIDDLAKWLGPAMVTFTGGEALLQPFTPEVVAHAVSRGLFVELLTHGYWSDRSRLERVALANPWRITMSMDGVGETHSTVRGRANFWELSHGSLMELARWRRERKLDYIIRLKTVVMSHNLDSVADVARFARENGAEVFYQPVEQNYNTPDDPFWHRSSPNWPRDSAKAIGAVEELIQLQQQGYPITNLRSQLEVMREYFRDPDRLNSSVRGHTAHERRQACAALSMLQLEANGDVRVCSGSPAVGNIREQRIRDIWNARPRWWRGGCCQERGQIGSEHTGQVLQVLP